MGRAGSAAPRARGHERRRAAAAVVHTHTITAPRGSDRYFFSFPSSPVSLGLFRSLVVIRRRDDHPLGSWTPELLQAQLRTYELRQSLSCNGM